MSVFRHNLRAQAVLFALVSVLLTGCSPMDAFLEPAIRDDRPTPPEVRTYLREQAKLDRTPHIIVRYLAPCFGVDSSGSEVFYFIKEVRWEVTRWKTSMKREVVLCSIRANGEGKREIFTLPQIDERQYWDLLGNDHLEVSLVGKVAVLGSESESDRGSILVFSLDGKSLHHLHPAVWDTGVRPNRVGHPTLSPDGQWVAFAEAAQTTMYKRIVKCRLDGSDYHVLSGFDGKDQAEQPAWSPKGDQIAFFRRNGGGGELRLIDINGQPLWALMNPYGCRNPRWSPDGREILIEGNTVVDAETHKVTGKLTGDHLLWGTWAGSVFAASNTNGIDFIDIQTGKRDAFLKNAWRRGNPTDMTKEEFRW